MGSQDIVPMGPVSKVAIHSHLTNRGSRCGMNSAYLPYVGTECLPSIVTRR